MSRIFLTAVLLSSTLCVLEITANCPYVCICERTFSICGNRQSHTGPMVGISPPTIDLNTVEALPGGVLPANLTEFNLQNSPIKSIAQDAFDDSAATLTSISLTECILTRIPDALLHLHEVNHLSISDTNIQDWNYDVMAGIGPRVTSFSLSNVGLSIWPSWMNTFTNVSQLSFGGSSLSSIPDDAFDRMEGLTSLSLYNNKLLAVPKALSRVTTLQSLDISENLISEISWLPKSSLLTSISLGGNKLSNSTHLSQVLLPYAHSMTSVDLHGNLLTSIPELDFLTEVDLLDISSNKLSDSKQVTLPAKLSYLELRSNIFSSVPSFVVSLRFIYTLSLSTNRVTGIRDTDLASCIRYVQLDKNLITELTDTSFPPYSGILSLNLDYNPLSRISLHAFSNLVNMTYLSMQNSLLTRLPLALAALTQLDTLDVSGSRYLVCTCMEKRLEKWVASRSVWSILGDCGQTSIYVFFTTLSPGCPVN